jgi:hypothetical protein
MEDKYYDMNTKKGKVAFYMENLTEEQKDKLLKYYLGVTTSYFNNIGEARELTYNFGSVFEVIEKSYFNDLLRKNSEKKLQEVSKAIDNIEIII